MFLKNGDERTFTRQLTQKMVKSFIGLTSDLNSIHKNKTGAQRSGFSNVVVQGMLCASLGGTVLWLLGGNGTLFGEWTKLRFIKPVYVNDTVSVHGKVKRLVGESPRYRRYLVCVEFKNQHGVDVIESTEVTMFVPK